MSDPITVRSPQEVTQLLRAWCSGEQSALDRLMPLVYAELHRLAHLYIARERPGHALQTSALVHEAYIRLIDASQIDWKDRAHFFAISARVMRRVLVEFARSRRSARRGCDRETVELDEGILSPTERGPDLVALDDALSALADADPREAKVVELRFFGGLTVEETAEALEVSVSTVLRDWEHARLWLLKELMRR